MQVPCTSLLPLSLPAQSNPDVYNTHRTITETSANIRERLQNVSAFSLKWLVPSPDEQVQGSLHMETWGRGWGGHLACVFPNGRARRVQDLASISLLPLAGAL
jgi:hypothetical protein